MSSFTSCLINLHHLLWMKGEDVIIRETRKLELNQQQSDADYVAECSQVSMMKQENKAIEDRIVAIKEECLR
mgnify:FL=1